MSKRRSTTNRGKSLCKDTHAEKALMLWKRTSENIAESKLGNGKRLESRQGQILQAMVRNLDVVVKSSGKTRTPELFIMVIVLSTALD